MAPPVLPSLLSDPPIRHFPLEFGSNLANHPQQPRRSSMVRRLGAPKIRQHPRILLLRRQSLHLARARCNLDTSLRLRPAHRLRKHNLLVTARIRLSPSMRQLRWQRIRSRIQRQFLGQQDLPCARRGRQFRLLGSEHHGGKFGFEFWWSGRCQEICDGWQ